MRIILYLGKGGVGKTTIAAATAVRCDSSSTRAASLAAARSGPACWRDNAICVGLLILLLPPLLMNGPDRLPGPRTACR